MRKAASIARGTWLETSEPMLVFSSRLMLISPSPTETGSISISTRLTRSSPRLGSRIRHTGKPIARSAGSIISIWTSVPATTPMA